MKEYVQINHNNNGGSHENIVTVFIISFTGFSISVNAQILVDTVADTTDSGDGVTTLREAVEAANVTAGVQIILFDTLVFPIDSSFVIYLDSALILTDEAGVIIIADRSTVILDGGEPAPGDITLPDTIFYSGLVLEAGSNEITRMKFQNFGVAGIEIDSLNTGNNKFTGNEIWYSGTGILVNTSDNNEYLYNNIHDNYNSGIEVDYSSNNLFHGNLLAFNGYDGLTIYEGSGGNNITENIVIGNGNDGLSLYGGQNNNNTILRNNIGDSSFVPPVPIGPNAVELSEVINRVDRKTLLKLRNIQEEGRIRSIKSRETRPERKSASERTNHTHKSDGKTDSRTSVGFAGDQVNAVRTRERKERIAAVRPTVRAEGGFVSAVSNTGNGYNGITLYGVSQTSIEDNLIFGSGYVGLYIEGFFEIDTTIVGVDTTIDTTYYFPDDIYVNDNRFVRNDNADIEFCYLEGMDVVHNSFRHSYVAIYGYGSYSLYDDSPEISGGIVNVINNDFTSGSNAYFFEAYYLYKANVYDNVIPSIYVATDLRDIAVINISDNRFDNTAYAVYVDFYDSLFVHHNYVVNGYSPFEMYTDSGYMEIMYNELTKSEYGMDFSGCNFCFAGSAIFSYNTIRGTYAYGITGYDMGYVEISDNYIEDVADYGISLADIRVSRIYRNYVSIGVYAMLAVYSVDSVYIEDNMFMGASDDDVAEIDMSIYAYIKNNVFRDGNSGVIISRINSLYFGYNKVSNTRDYGLYLSRIGYGLIDYNKIYDHMYTGMYLWRVNNTMVENNYVSVNGDNGIFVNRSSNVEIRYNTIMDNKDYGVYSSLDTNITIDENFISLNDVGIYILSGVSTQRANHNSFFRNFEYGIFSNIAFDGKFNFWGHPDGPTIDGTAIALSSTELMEAGTVQTGEGGGDHVNTNVDADSFSTTWEFVPLHSPKIAEVRPDGGPREGGIRGKIHGALFLPGVEVFFGGEQADLVDYYASNVLEFDLPVGRGGPEDVIVFNRLNNTSDTLFSGFFYDNESPGAALLVLPPQNSTVDSVDVQFGWESAIDPDGDDVVYTLIYSKAEDFPDSNTVEIQELTDIFYTLDEVLKSETDYFWKIIASDTRTGISESVVSTFKTNEVVIGVDDEGILPKEFSLSQNFPNPFNPSTVINYALPKDSDVKLIIYNLKGQVVENLINGKQNAGYKSIKWNGGNSASGLYIYRLTAGDFVRTRKMVLLK